MQQNQQPANSRNQTMGELPPVNPIDSSYTPPSNKVPVPPPILPKRSKKPFIIIFLLITILLIGLGWWYMSIDHAADTTANTPPATEEELAPQPTEPLITYIGKNSNQKQELLVTDSKQKSIAALEQSEGKNNFKVLANNWDKILVEEYFFSNESPTDSAKNYYTIDKAGKTTKLSEAVAAKLSSIKLNKPYFGGDNNIVYAGCDKDSCDIFSMEINSGAATSVFSLAYTPSDAAGEPSTVELIGATWDNSAWAVAYKEGVVKPGTLTQIDIATKKTKTENIMAAKSLNTPDLSYDYSKIIYTSLVDNQTINIMDTNSGKTDEIKPETPAGSVYYWSPDNSSAAFVAEAGPLATAQNNVRIASVSITDKTAKELVSYGDVSFNNLILGGWSSNTLVNYVHTATTTPSDFRGGVQTIYTVDNKDGSITSNPVPLGYVLVSPQSLNGVFLVAS